VSAVRCVDTEKPRLLELLRLAMAEL
jgi:hypothetical protein